MADVVAGSYRFDAKYRQQLVHLAQHLGPDDPKFVTLGLRPLDAPSAISRPISTTVWYVGHDRYHLQSMGSGKVLAAELDKAIPVLQVS